MSGSIGSMGLQMAMPCLPLEWSDEHQSNSIECQAGVAVSIRAARVSLSRATFNVCFKLAALW